MITNKDYMDFIKAHYSKVLVRALEYDLTHNSLPAYEKMKAIALKAYLEKEE